MIDSIKESLECDDVIVIAIHDDKPEETQLVTSLDSDEDIQAVLFYMLSKNMPDEEDNLEDTLANLVGEISPKEMEALNQFLKQTEQLRKDLGLR